MASRVIALDGPAGSGKSTTARVVAEKLGFGHIDSGALYRALTLAALDANLPDQADRIVGLARTLPVRLALTGVGYRPEVAGVDVSAAIRETRVTERVSAVAALPPVREWVNAELRGAAAEHPAGVVIDGRDIGTVVFPEATVKIFLTASGEERARRRSREVELDASEAGVRRVRAELDRRDTADSTRAVAPLSAAPDAIVLDGTSLSFLEQVDAVVRLARKTIGSHA
ncbi:MAG: (d)CMP kinase [Gemmatimonadetes bacterium]|nr:(d)CMP kinase [Gemmatimonadota bacterium]